MKRLHILALAVIGALGTYFFLKPSPTETLIALLQDTAGPAAAVSIDGCDLSIVVNSSGQASGPVALSRLVIQANLRDYKLETVTFIPGTDRLGMHIDRQAVDDRMLAQAARIIEAGREPVQQLYPDLQSLQIAFEAQGTSLFFRISARIEQTEDGLTTLIAHEDAPEFYRFATAVEALPAPLSYRISTAFAPGEASAETLRTGEIAVLPPLQFQLTSDDDASELAQAFYRYAAENECL